MDDCQVSYIIKLKNKNTVVHGIQPQILERMTGKIRKHYFEKRKKRREKSVSLSVEFPT